MLTHKPDKRVFILNLNFNETVSFGSRHKFPSKRPFGKQKSSLEQFRFYMRTLGN